MSSPVTDCDIVRFPAGRASAGDRGIIRFNRVHVLACALTEREVL